MYSTTYKLGGGVLFDEIKITKVDEIHEDNKISVLIVDGFSNHNWQLNTPYLSEILGESGKFEVDVTTSPIQEVDSAAWQK